MFVDSGDDGSHDDGECGAVSGGSIDCLGVQHHDSVLGGNAPIIVFSTTVDIVEGFLLQQSGHAMASRDLLNYLHDHKVLIDLGGVVTVKRGELVLVGGDLSVAGLEWDSEPPALVLDLLHASKGGVGQTGRGHVVVTHLLPTWRVAADDGSTGQLQVGAAVILVAGNEEELLLQANVGDHLLGADVKPEVLKKAFAMLRQSSIGPQQGRLLVERCAIVADKGGGDEDGVSAQEDG